MYVLIFCAHTVSPRGARDPAQPNMKSIPPPLPPGWTEEYDEGFMCAIHGFLHTQQGGKVSQLSFVSSRNIRGTFTLRPKPKALA